MVGVCVTEGRPPEHDHSASSLKKNAGSSDDRQSLVRHTVQEPPRCGPARHECPGDATMTTRRLPAILADPEKYEGQTVLVQGTIEDVCPRRGC